MGTSPVCLHVLKSLMGSLEDGSVVTWVWVPKFPMDSLGEGSVAAFPKSLMDSMEDGSVVTWKRVPKSLKHLLENGSVVTTLNFLISSGMGSEVCDGLTRSCLRRHHSEVPDG